MQLIALSNFSVLIHPVIKLRSYAVKLRQRLKPCVEFVSFFLRDNTERD